MLSRLQISNYAIISELNTNFTKGLNIITGETGAGKSIVAGALGLILGDRADSSVLLDKTSKCIVEGSFVDHAEDQVRQFFIDNDIETDQEIILRREISANGKSRAFINDTPVNLGQLQKLASMLVDLHRQFDTRELGEDHFQLEVLDALSAQLELRKEYSKAYQEFSLAKQKEDLLKKQKAEALKEYDYHLFLFNELEAAAFREGEIETLEAELNMLTHAEQVNAALSRTEAVLDGEEQSMARELKSLVQSLESVSRYSAGIQTLVDRLRSTQIEIKDIAEEAIAISQSINMDEKRLNLVQERVSLGYRLMKKHNVSETNGLIAIHENLQHKISKVIDLDGEIEKAGRELEKKEEQTDKIAAALTSGRRKAIPLLEKKIAGMLAQVGMPNARLKVKMEPVIKTAAGADDVDFLFDANKSDRFESLRKVASGGELSRLLLCVKTLVAGSVQMPVLIFDEIDTGISGEAARQVGILMKEMGREHQVISITHQPQIAARADHHFFVYKKEIGGSLKTQMKQLSEDERVETIARMMTGEKLSNAALQNARELISSH